MHSEFYNVALDRVRYSLVWEDATTLYNVLNISSHDHLLIITSGGCNVFNALLKNPASVTAIDLNPVQNKLLLLKKHIVLHHDYSTFRACLGLDGEEAVAHGWHKVQSTLPEKFVAYWTSFFNAHPEGLLTSGKLEAYLTGFYNTLEKEIQEKLKHLLQFKNVQQQYEYFVEQLDQTSFSASFISYFDDQNLSKGRDPKLFKYADESGGRAFYKRLVKQLSSVLVSSNFYFRFFFFGPLGIPEKLLPPCYQQENFPPLKAQLSKLSIVTSEAIDYLLSPRGKHINKASLSNIFEYTTHTEFKNVCKSLYKKGDRELKIVFWNLLHEQGKQEQAIEGMNIKVADDAAASESCFYFKDVRVIESSAVNTSQPKLITKA